MRLKHMVKDKINYRATGPRTNLTRQTVQGRANDGGLRIGEMERDGVLAHGMSYFLNESFMIRGDEYFMAICNKTGAIAIYNESKNLFLSPYADGPITFVTNPDGSQNIKNLSKFGRSFSILRIPYSLKLLIQELQVMNVQMRIITEDNIDQLLSMSFSNNITKLIDLVLNIFTLDVGFGSATIDDSSKFGLMVQRVLGLCFDFDEEINVGGSVKTPEIDNVTDTFFEFGEVDLRTIEQKTSNIKLGKSIPPFDAMLYIKVSNTLSSNLSALTIACKVLVSSGFCVFNFSNSGYLT
jgi:hypothetical protein